MEAVNDTLKLIARARAILKRAESYKENEQEIADAISLLDDAVDKLAQCST